VAVPPPTAVIPGRCLHLMCPWLPDLPVSQCSNMSHLCTRMWTSSMIQSLMSVLLCVAGKATPPHAVFVAIPNGQAVFCRRRSLQGNRRLNLQALQLLRDIAQTCIRPSHQSVQCSLDVTLLLCYSLTCCPLACCQKM
jgi:hypothetical protein